MVNGQWWLGLCGASLSLSSCNQAPEHSPFYPFTALIIQHPGILGASALRGIDHKRPLLERHARQAARHDLDTVRDQDVRPKVHVARRKALLGQDRASRQRER